MHTQLGARPSPIAGRWYPDNPQDLAESVDDYIHKARLPEIPGDIIAVVAPHAGYLYSGPVAGHAFAAVRGLQPELVAVVSPMHYPYTDPVLTSAHSAYATPLGEIRIDQMALQDLDNHLKHDHYEPISRVGRDPEHSLEIELPFLQRALSAKFTLLPLMVRELNPKYLQNLGKNLARTLHKVAEGGKTAFYQGEIAEAIAKLLAGSDPLDLGAARASAGLASSGGGTATRYEVVDGVRRPVTIKWLFTLLMWLGRLEIVPVLIIFMGAITGIQNDLANTAPPGYR